MSVYLLERFLKWAEDSFREDFPTAAVIKCPETSNSACYVELESDVGIGRITVWEDGSYAKEYIGLDQNITPISERGSDLQLEDFETKFQDIREFLKKG